MIELDFSVLELPLQRLGMPLALAPAHVHRERCPATCTVLFDHPMGDERVDDPDVMLKWQPGDAIVGMTGSLFDVIDIDPRNSGESAQETVNRLKALDVLPKIYGVATTPSQGLHLYVAPMGLKNLASTQMGIDIRGEGGLVYVAPTEKPHKQTGELRAYSWLAQPRPPQPGSAAGFARWYKSETDKIRQEAYAKRNIVTTPGKRPSPLKTWRADIEVDGRNETLNRVVSSLASYGEGRTVAQVFEELQNLGIHDEIYGAPGFPAWEYEYVVNRTTRQLSRQYTKREAAPGTEAASLGNVANPTTPAQDIAPQSEEVGWMVVSASGVVSTRRTWLWENMLLAQAPTLLGGQGGEGKSLFVTHVAAQVTLGTLPGDYYGQPGTVLYLTSEDSWITEQKPRFQAAGANLELVKSLFWGGDHRSPVIPKFPSDTAKLAMVIEQVKPVLLVIDPITSFSEGSSNDPSEVRRMMDSFIKVAMAHDVACLVVHHFNKSGGSLKNLFSGAHSYLDAVRAGLGFMYDEDRDARFLGVVKGNYLPKEIKSYRCDLAVKDILLDDGHTQSVPYYTQVVPSDITLQDVLDKTGTQVEIVGKQAIRSLQDEVNDLCEQGITSGARIAQMLDSDPNKIRPMIARWRRKIDA